MYDVLIGSVVSPYACRRVARKFKINRLKLNVKRQKTHRRNEVRYRHITYDYIIRIHRTQLHIYTDTCGWGQRSATFATIVFATAVSFHSRFCRSVIREKNLTKWKTSQNKNPNVKILGKIKRQQQCSKKKKQGSSRKKRDFIIFFLVCVHRAKR